MKIQTKSWLKSLVSLVLCLSMVLCTPLMAFAAETDNVRATEKKADIIYVSIGDSMTNGFCLDGYDGNSGGSNYGNDTYSNLFAAYLAGYEGKINDDQVIFEGTKGTVDHRQLAISGMRSQDIQWILELNYDNSELMNTIFNTAWTEELWYDTWGFNGDRRTYNDYCNHNFRYPDAAARILTVYNDKNGDGYGYYETSSKYLIDGAIENAVNGVAKDPYYPEKEQVNEFGGYRSLQIATEFYQKSVKDADIISLSVGNTNFGTHMLYEFFEVFMYGRYNFEKNFMLDRAYEMANADPISQKIVEDLIASDEYKKIVASCTAFAGSNEKMANSIKYIVEYCTVGYIASYVGLLNAILEANPDVEIIQLPLMNAYEPQTGVSAPGTLGEFVDIIYKPINKILEELPAKYAEKYPEANFYFTEDCYVSCMVDAFGDDFYKDSKNNFVEYSGFLNGNENNYTANDKSTSRERFAGEIISGSMFFGVLQQAGLTKTKDYNNQNLYNFLYGGKVTVGGNVVYNGCGAAAYDMMTLEEKAIYAAQNSAAAQDYAYYLAFENAIIRSGVEDIKMEALASLGNLASVLGPFYSSLPGKIAAASKDYYDEAAAVVVAQSGGALTKDDVLLIMTLSENATTDEEKALLPYTFIAEKGKDQTMGLIDAKDIKRLCEATNYENEVYALISDKAKTNFGIDTFTPELAKTLTGTEGVWEVASALTGYSAKMIKLGYENNALEPEQIEQINMLMSVREGIIALLGNENTFKQSAALLNANISTIVGAIPSLGQLLAIPQTMADALYDYENMRGALCLDARILLGTGAGGHPSPAGHVTLYNTIIDAFDYTVSYEWSEDFAKCSAIRKVGTDVIDTVTVEAVSETTKEANCKEPGEIKFTAVFNKYWAETQYETKEIPVTDHDYSKITADPTWTWTEDYKASAVFTCPVCNKPIDVTENVVVSGKTTKEPTCRDEGTFVYTATVEFNGKNYSSSKDKVLEKLEHNFGEDGRCENILLDGTVCGEYNLEKYGQCTPTVNAELTSGSTLTMLLDGNNAGEFSFAETESGWTIVNAEGKYLASDANGNLVLSDSAYNWNYADGKFSTTVKVASSNWLEALLGITKDATYYIAYSEGSVVVNASGSAVTFSTTENVGYHTFGEINVVEPTCTEKGYTERTCSVCGEIFKTDEVKELGHSYVDTVVAPKCGVEGYTEHKCACGDSYVDTKVPALEHDFSGENDTCIHCGKSDVAVYGECEYNIESSISDGTYTLSLGGTEVGTYTFASVNGGYAIKDSNGKYIGVDSNGAITYSDTAFTWTYANGQFSATVGKTSTNWLEALLGMGKSTTYYLVASGSSVAVSTTGAEAKFFVKGTNETHTFEESYVEPECGVNGYTEYTCTVCGDKFTKEDVGSALEHSHTVTATVEVTCLTDGYSVYTCSKCGDTYNDDFVTASGSHNFGEDGTCQNVLPSGVCGEPDEPECVYEKEHTLISGNTYELVLGEKSVGEYTFSSENGKWNIMNSEGKYLALENGKLVVSDSAYAWSYSNGRFSSSSSASSGTTGIDWLDALLGGKKSTYYLVSSGNDVTVSTSTSAATAKFVAEVIGEHNYSEAKPVDGNHVYTCYNCGYEKTESCNDDNCVLCNASVDVSVSIEKVSSGNWFEVLLGIGSKTNKVTITTVATGTEVTSVEYSLDGTSWTQGTSFTSKTEVTSFNIRVKAANGITYNYLYINGSVQAI